MKKLMTGNEAAALAAKLAKPQVVAANPVAPQKYREIDYDHCKGCGVFAAECPRAANDWVKSSSTQR